MTINDYATIAEVKEGFPDIATPEWSTIQTSLLTSLLTDASRAVDRFTKRLPGSYKVDTDSTMYYDGYGINNAAYYPYGVQSNQRNTRITDNVLRVDELISVTSIALSLSGSVSAYSTSVANTDYYLAPYNAPNFGKPYTSIVLDVVNGSYAVWPAYPKSIKIIGKFGYSATVPGEVRRATIMQAGRWYSRARQAYQNSMTVTEGENTISYTDKLDTDLQNLLKHITRQSI